MHGLCIRNRSLGPEDLALIRELIQSEGALGRSHLSDRLCRLWDWRQPNGHYREIACRDLLRQLDRKGLIALPPPKRTARLGCSKDRIERRPLRDGDESLTREHPPIVSGAEVEVLPASNGQQRRLFDQLIGRAHYLGYHRPTGACLKYIVWAQEQPVGGLSFGPAAWQVAARDQWIGWPASVRPSRLHLIVNNDRFVILPGVRPDHVASFVLAACLRRVAADWQARYCYRPVLAETFVEDGRFAGTCYAAANWHYLGQTRGRGRNDRLNLSPAPRKSLWVYPLHRNFRKVLHHG